MKSKIKNLVLASILIAVPFAGYSQELTPYCLNKLQILQGRYKNKYRLCNFYSPKEIFFLNLNQKAAFSC